MNKQRSDALDLLNDIGVDADLVAGLASTDVLTPEALFNREFDEYWLEIGFGNGDFLAQAHREYPNIGFVGAEPFMNGVAALLKSVQADKVPENLCKNLRVWPDDVRPLLRALPEEMFSRIYILNPDPWPKSRHHKRRIVNPQTLDWLARILKPGGELIMTTDIAELAEWMIIQTTRHPRFSWPVDSPSRAEDPPEGWLPTRYEQKGREAGRRQYYLQTICN